MREQLVEQNMYSIDPVFYHVAENLKTELKKISTAIEYSILTKDFSNLEMAQFSTQGMLRLIDCYQTYINRQDLLSLIEPVSLSAIMSEIISDMKPYAHWRQCDLDLAVEGKFQPVLANKEMLHIILGSLSSIFLSAQSELRPKKRPLIMYAVSRNKQGVTAGIYSDLEGFNSEMLIRARKLFGKAMNPVNGLISNTNAGLFLADSLLGTVASGLKVAKLNNLYGFATTFKPSQQLILV